MNFHKNHWLLFSVIFFGYIALSFVVGIGPAIWTENHTEPLPAAEPLSALEQRGLDIYVTEGCIACHTQQVRPLEMDAVWGRPSAPADYAYVEPMGFWSPNAPAILGSARTGPDLSNVGARQPSKAWQYIHLYNPRAVVPDSVMPAYPWLFEVVENPGNDDVVVPIPDAYAPETGQVVVAEQAKALVAYLLSRVQVPLEPASTDAKTQAPQETVEPEAAATANAELGATLYSNTCASCHQANGQGLPGVFPPLAGDPVVTADDPTEHITIVLNGLQGKAIDGVDYASPMPAFGSQLSDEEIAAVINHERSSWGNSAPTVTAEDVATVRGGAQ